MSKTDERKFDTRLIERTIREGNMDQKLYDQFLKALPDSETEAEYIEIDTSELGGTASESELILEAEDDDLAFS